MAAGIETIRSTGVGDILNYMTLKPTDIDPYSNEHHHEDQRGFLYEATHVGVVLLSCWSFEAAKAPKSALQDISYCALVKNPLSFSGRRIRVRAIY